MKRTTSLSVVLLAICIAAPAYAHFTLMQPQSVYQLDSLGSPQKSAPCGQADPGSTATPTNAVASYKPGDTVTITLQETVFHPGHYRVALAATQDALPGDPPVTAGSTPCGSTVIATNPQLPLLADGALQHTSALSGPQTIQVTLPAGMSCDHCVLQVIEFMSNHPLNNPGGCFYHHCATINVTPNGGGSGDAGVNPNPDAGTGGGKSSGGCATTGGAVAGSFALAFAVGLVALRRRRR